MFARWCPWPASSAESWPVGHLTRASVRLMQRGSFGRTLAMPSKCWCVDLPRFGGGTRSSKSSVVTVRVFFTMTTRPSWRTREYCVPLGSTGTRRTSPLRFDTTHSTLSRLMQTRVATAIRLLTVIVSVRRSSESSLLTRAGIRVRATA